MMAFLYSLSGYGDYRAVRNLGANWLWNICSTHCQPTVSGPLVVTETIFGLLFTFLYQQRWPALHEAGAIVLFGVGISLTIYSEMKKI